MCSQKWKTIVRKTEDKSIQHWILSAGTCTTWLKKIMGVEWQWQWTGKWHWGGSCHHHTQNVPPGCDAVCNSAVNSSMSTQSNSSNCEVTFLCQLKVNSSNSTMCEVAFFTGPFNASMLAAELPVPLWCCLHWSGPHIAGQASFALTSLERLSLVAKRQSRGISILQNVDDTFPDLEKKLPKTLRRRSRHFMTPKRVLFSTQGFPSQKFWPIGEYLDC